MKNMKIGGHFRLMLLRITLLYLLMAMSRLFFYIYNIDVIDSLTLSSLPSIIKASFIFDTASIFYVNILFILLSLIPFNFREKGWWQAILGVIFTLTNSAALFVSISDIFYFRYKLSRIAGDDLRYFSEDNFWSLFWSSIGQYWFGILFFVLLVVVLYYVGFVLLKLKIKRHFISNKPVRYAFQTIILVFSMLFAIVGIRGFSISAATFPITMSDATSYVEPKYASLVLSNPFCLIRTFNHSLVSPQLSKDTDLYQPVQSVDSCQYNIENMNIVLVVLESFGSAHIKSLSDSFKADDITYTPFLDSLFQHGLLMTSAYQSGGRSIDAMPAMWASIPSYKQNFLSLPQSAAEYKALPDILSDMGYTTSFMHGATESSMSFKSFGQMAGINNFTALEDYESEVGRDDFDGKWGVFDHKFLPFALSKIDELKSPFFNTIFTLSSHHPYTIPKGYEDKYPTGKIDIHKTIAYSDDALRAFFNGAKSKPWYNNTLFIVTADHGSGADNAKWLKPPYNYRVPIFMYTPSGIIPAQKIDKVVSHIDLMPTLLSMMNYKDKFFGYGTNYFEVSEKEPFVVNSFMGTYNVVTKDILYQFNDKDLVGVYDYINDYLLKNNLVSSHKSSDIEFYKAYIQSYYTMVGKRKYTVN